MNALNAASAGATVVVPAGSCIWSNLSVSVNKAVTLRGAGTGLTQITVNANQAFTVNQQSGGIIRIKGFSFVSSNNNTLPHPIVIGGVWPTGKPVIFENNDFTMSGSTMFDVQVPGGVIFSHNTFTGGWNDFSFAVKDIMGGLSWITADSLGTNDTDGTKNIYIEDNTFNGQSNGTIDCDDNCRVVMRHNSFIESGGFNSHGKDTSASGLRHFEIYDNSFTFPDKTCNNGTNSLSNISQYLWIRGGTGVVFNNSMEDISSVCWGNKAEVKLSIRGAEDARPQGTCQQVSYPVPHQLGQGNNGTMDFTDPIYFWNNTGTVQIGADWNWGNPCGFTFSTFFQWGRDAINSSGMGGIAKPGYTPYTYPHSLVGGSIDTTAPTPGDSGTITTRNITASRLTLNWTKGADPDDVQSSLLYAVCRSTSNNISTVAQCESNGVLATPFTTDIATAIVTGLTQNTTYYLNVLVEDLSGNKSSYATVSATTGTDPTFPTVGNSGTITTSNITLAAVTLNWTKSSDTDDDQNTLLYEVCRSTSNNVTTVAQCEAATVFTSFTTDIATTTAIGLLPSTNYYFNVVVRDPAGNKTAYVPVNATTSAPPPGVSVDTVGPGSSGASAHGNISTLSWDHTCSNCTSIVVGCALGDNPDDKTLSVTFNSLAMSTNPSAKVHSFNNNTGYAQLFWLGNPTSGTHTVTVNVSSALTSTNGTLLCGSISFFGSDTNTGVTYAVSAFGSSANPSVTVPSASGNMVVDMMASGTTGTTTSGQTLRWSKGFNSETAAGNAASSTAMGATSVVMGYAIPSDWWGIVGANISTPENAIRKRGGQITGQ